MSKQEVKCIENYLNKDMIMLEWGSGGSTVYFPRFVKFYHSIEHNKFWYDKIYNELPDNAKLYYVKNNKKRTIPSKREQFTDYVEYVHSIGVPKFDAVFIDGRARIYCAGEVIPYLKKDSVVFLHDSHRAEYKPIFAAYDVVEIVGTLSVMKLKERFL